MKKIQKQKKGFTLLEILLVIALIGILVTIIIVVLNPKSRFASARNDTRQSDIKKIEGALIQYRLQEGSYPAGLTTTLQEICDPDIANPSTNCGININLSVLVPIYLQSIPQDPNDKDTTGGNGYQVAVDTTRNIVAVKAIQAESSATISINDPLPGETTVTANTPLAATVLVNPIVTNGLVLHLDAGNTASYPGTGTTWTDLSGNSNNGTLVNGPTYNSANGGSLVFDGVDDYVVTTPISNTGNGGASQSYCLWIRPNDDNGNILSMSQSNPQGGWNMPPIAVSGSRFRGKFWSNQYLNAASTYTNSQWYYVCLIFSYNSVTANAYQRLYVNGNLNSEQTNIIYSASGSNNSLFFGQQNPGADNTGMFAGSYGSIQIYMNKALTTEEIQQNYNATKDRFGL
jgi:prepilin-type N-terminal cleavage/methylation domain-containing protein